MVTILQNKHAWPMCAGFGTPAPLSRNAVTEEASRQGSNMTAKAPNGPRIIVHASSDRFGAAPSGSNCSTEAAVLPQAPGGNTEPVVYRLRRSFSADALSSTSEKVTPRGKSSTSDQSHASVPAGPATRSPRVSWRTSLSPPARGRGSAARGQSPREDPRSHAGVARLGNAPAQGTGSPEGQSESLDSARGTGAETRSIRSLGSGTVEDADVETVADEGSEADSSMERFNEDTARRVRMTDQELTALAGRMRDAVDVKDR